MELQMLALADVARRFPFRQLTVEVCSGKRATISILWVLDNLAYFQCSQGQKVGGCFSQQHILEFAAISERWNYGNVASSMCAEYPWNCKCCPQSLHISKIKFKDMITKITTMIIFMNGHEWQWSALPGIKYVKKLFK